MRKKMAYSLALLSILIVVSATYAPALAATYQVGVQVGNTANYTASITSSNETKFQLSVFSVYGPVATLNATRYYANGTLDKSTSFSQAVNVTSTTGSGLGWAFLIAKNLTHGDPVYPTGYTINETTTMIVAGVNRTVNHLSLGGIDNFYWDKATGIIVKMNLWFFAWLNLTMTSTNMWAPSGGLSTTTLLLIGGVAAVVIIAAALVLVRRRK